MIDTHWRQEMRTNIVIDDELMKSALKASGLKTKKDAIETGLRLLVHLKGQEEIKKNRIRVFYNNTIRISSYRITLTKRNPKTFTKKTPSFRGIGRSLLTLVSE